MTDRELEEREKREKRRHRGQRLCGLFLVLFCVLAFVLASTGTTMEARDGTAAAVVLPIGLYLLFGKEIQIHG